MEPARLTLAIDELIHCHTALHREGSRPAVVAGAHDGAGGELGGASVRCRGGRGDVGAVGRVISQVGDEFHIALRIRRHLGRAEVGLALAGARRIAGRVCEEVQVEDRIGAAVQAAFRLEHAPDDRRPIHDGGVLEPVGARVTVAHVIWRDPIAAEVDPQ